MNICAEIREENYSASKGRAIPVALRVGAQHVGRPGPYATLMDVKKLCFSIECPALS